MSDTVIDERLTECLTGCQPLDQLNWLGLHICQWAANKPLPPSPFVTITTEV